MEDDNRLIILKVVSGPDTGRTIRVDDESISVGRSERCGIALPDPTVSRHHFSLVRTLSGWTLVEAGSGNGTFLNGNQVATSAGPVTLGDGDRISVGRTVIVVGFDDGGADFAGDADGAGGSDGGGGNGDGNGGGNGDDCGDDLRPDLSIRLGAPVSLRPEKPTRRVQFIEALPFILIGLLCLFIVAFFAGTC